MRTVEKLPSGRYKVRYRYGGKQSSQTFDRRKDAARFAALLDAFGDAQEALDQIYEESQLRKIPCLSDVAEDHIRLLTSATEGTQLSYRRLWGRTWGPLLGDLPANRVNRDRISAATIQLARSYSHKSLKNQRGLLAAVCKRAVRLGYLSTNPCEGLGIPRTGETTRRDMRILTPAEFAGVLERCNAHYRPFIRFLAGTGARFGEAVALQVQDVSLPDVRIRRALKWSPDNKRTIGPPKTVRSNRTVTLPGEVARDLGPLLDRPGDALLFTAPRGGPIQHRTFWSDIWLPAVEHLSPRPRLHDLRHTHAAWLLAAGVPVHVVSRRLGHESIKTTVDVYGGLLPDAQVAAAAAADAVFGAGAHELG